MIWTVTAVALMLAGCGGPIAAPTSYGKYFNKDGGFNCEYPTGWEADGGGKSTHWAKFNKSSAQVKVQTDISGSVMGDMSSIGGGTKLGAPEEDEMPVHKVHMMGHKLAEEYPEYKEGVPVKFLNQLGGEGRKSEFTAAGGLSGGTHGYRATILNRDRRFTILCTCKESDWAALKPAFDHVLESFKSGGEQ